MCEGGSSPAALPATSGRESSPVDIYKRGPSLDDPPHSRERSSVHTSGGESQDKDQDTTDATPGCVAACQPAHMTPWVQGLGFPLDLV